MAKKIQYLGKNPHKKKKEKQDMTCPYCGRSIQFVHVSQMNFHFDIDSCPEYYWRCSNYPACDTYISADRNTKKPFGTLANANLRYKRRSIHQWKDILANGRFMTSDAFLGLCGQYVGIRNPDCVHVREFSEYTCDQILNQLGEMYKSNKRIKELVDLAKFSMPWKQCHGVDAMGKPGLFLNDKGEPIDRPAFLIGYQPVVTMGAENSKKLARNRVHVNEEQQRELVQLAHQYAVEYHEKKAAAEIA